MTESTSGSAKQGSLFEDILEVNWAPGAVFERARDSGAGKYILVLTVVCLVIVVATKGLVQPYIDANFDLQMQLMARRGQAMPPEAIETARRFGAYGYLGTAVLLVPMSALFGGVILWLSAKLVTAPVRFGQAALIATFGAIPRIVSFLATAAQGALVDAASIRSLTDASLGPARFFDPVTTSPAVMGLLANADVFSIWQLVIFGVGVSVIAKVARSTGFVAAGIAWGISAALMLIPAVLTG